jgi:hypothetical protein
MKLKYQEVEMWTDKAFRGVPMFNRNRLMHHG